MYKANCVTKRMIFAVCALLMALAMRMPVYAAQGDATSAPDGQAAAQAKIDWAGARVVLSSYSVLDGDISDGKIRLRIILKNESGYYDARSVLVTYDCDKRFFPAYGASNQFFISHIPAQSTVEHEITLAVDATTTVTSFTMEFTAEYVDEISAKAVNRFYIGGLLGQNLNTIRLTGIAAIGPVSASGETPVRIAVDNPAEFDVKNAEMVVGSAYGEGVQRVAIGDIEAGGRIEREISLILPESRAPQITVAFAYTGQDEVTYTTKEESFTMYGYQDPASAGQTQAAPTSALTKSQLTSAAIYASMAVITVILLVIVIWRRYKLRQ